MRARTSFAAVCLLMASVACGAEQERVLSFHSDIVIGADDSLAITETIRLVVTGDKIKRGILRDFPIVLRDAKRRKVYGFDVKGVLRDGKPEPFAVDRMAKLDYARIKIGNPAVFLPAGEHTYAITYHTTGHIRFFDDHDELYFNVNGTEWDFPLDKVSATVALPPGAKLFKNLATACTGAAGEKGKDYAAKLLPDGKAFFETTRPFNAGENLTIVILLEKGAVKQPPPLKEKVLGFHSDIAVGPDGAMTVTETIRLVAAGEKIDYGICRDIPVALRGPLQRKTFGFNVLRVLCDHLEERHSVKTDEVGDCARIKTGMFGTSLSDGEHTYTISYQTTGHVRFLAGRDELALDLNAAGLPLPLEEVSATIALPQGAQLLEDRVAASVRKDLTWKRLPDGKITFESTRELQAGESLAIVVPLAKGAIAEPSAAEKRRAWLKDNLPAAIALGGFGAVMAFLAVAWVLVGRRPARGPATPSPEPPVDPQSGRTLSPAEVAFVRGMGFDETCVTPALLNMGVEGYLAIEESKADGNTEYAISLREGADPARLTPDEQRLAGKVFADGRRTVSLKSSDSTLFTGVAAMRDAMEAEWGRATFRRHAGLRGLGWTLAALATCAAAFCNALDDPLGYWTLIAAACAPALLLVHMGAKYLVSQLGQLASSDPKRPTVGGWLLAALGIGVPSAALLFAFYKLSHLSTVWVPLGVFGMFWANVELGPLLKRYTRRGRIIMDQAGQLALHLTTVGADPRRPSGPEAFERLLPYAMALGLADRWSKTFLGRFQQALAGVTGESGDAWTPKEYRPLWYRAHMAFSLFEAEWSFYKIMEHEISRRLPSGRVVSASSSSSSERSGSSWRASTTGSGSGGYSGGGSGGGGGKGW